MVDSFIGLASAPCTDEDSPERAGQGVVFGRAAGIDAGAETV